MARALRLLAVRHCKARLNALGCGRDSTAREVWKVTDPDKIVIWLSGYYNGTRGNTILDNKAIEEYTGRLRAAAGTISRCGSCRPPKRC
jgi:hypothetical protein